MLQVYIYVAVLVIGMIGGAFIVWPVVREQARTIAELEAEIAARKPVHGSNGKFVKRVA